MLVAAIVSAAALVAALRGREVESSSDSAGTRVRSGAVAAIGDARAPSPSAAAAARRRRSPPADATTTSPEPTEARCVVRVRVTAAADGAPVRGVEVVIGDANFPWPDATTDASGAVTLSDVDAGTAHVFARKRGFVAASQRVTARTDAEVEVDLELELGAVVDVLVLDALTQAPVVGATVALESETGDLHDVVGTAEGGRGISPGLVPSDTVMLAAAEADGYLRAVEPFRAGPAGDAAIPVVVRLHPAATLTGVVRDPDGELCGSATVRLRRDGSDRVEREESVSADGAFALGGLFPGRTYSVTAAALGWSESAPVRVAAWPGVAESVDLALRPETTVIVMTVDDDARPLGDVHLDVDNHGSVSTSRSRGSVRRLQVEPGRCRVLAQAEHRVPATAERDLAVGETWELTLLLSSGASIAGMVTDTDGKPVEDALLLAPVPVDAATRAAGTDESGRFALHGVAPGAHDLRVSAGIDFDAAVVCAVAPSEGVRVVLPRRGRLRMRMEFDGTAPNLVQVDGTDASGGRISVQNSLRNDGRFDTAWPHDAGGMVVVSAPGFAPTTRTVSVPHGAVADLGVVRLARGATVTGTLRHAGGRRAGYIGLHASQQAAPGRFVTATTDDDGAFVLRGLLPGRAVVVAYPDDGPAVTYDVEVGSGGPLDLALPAVGVLWVRVVGADGGPEVGVPVSVLGSDGRPLTAEWARAATDDAGGAALRFSAGRARIDVGGRAQRDVDVRPGDLTILRVDLR